MSSDTNQTLEHVCVRSAESGALECFDQLRIVVEQSNSPLDVLVIIFSLTASVVIGFLSVFLAFWGFKISKQAVESAREAAGIAERANDLAASEATENRVRNALSVRPFFTNFMETPKVNIFSFGVTNKGNGLARIKDFRLIIDGEVISISDHDTNSHTRLGEAFWRCFKKVFITVHPEHASVVNSFEYKDGKLSFHGMYEGSIISSGEEIEVFKYIFPHEHNQKIYRELHARIKVAIIFEDMFGNLIEQSNA